jgi:hypothetical protein
MGDYIRPSLLTLAAFKAETAKNPPLIDGFLVNLG